MRVWSGARSFLVGLILASGLAGATFWSSPSRAGVTGDTINGSMGFCVPPVGGNQFTPTSGTAPLAFGYNDGTNAYTATFTDAELTVEASSSDFSCGFGMSFTDTTKPFSMLVLESSSFPTTDLAYSLDLSGNITVTWAGTPGFQDSVHDPVDHVAVFQVAEELPEPGSLAVFGVGLIGAGLVRHRRRPATQAESVVLY